MFVLITIVIKIVYSPTLSLPLPNRLGLAPLPILALLILVCLAKLAELAFDLTFILLIEFDGLGLGLVLGLLLLLFICSNLPARSLTRLACKVSSASLVGTDMILAPSATSAFTTRNFDFGTVNMTCTTRRSTAASTSQSASLAGVHGLSSPKDGLGTPSWPGLIGV
jgi:hypothetical protein